MEKKSTVCLSILNQDFEIKIDENITAEQIAEKLVKKVKQNKQFKSFEIHTEGANIIIPKQ